MSNAWHVNGNGVSTLTLSVGGLPAGAFVIVASVQVAGAPGDIVGCTVADGAGAMSSIARRTAYGNPPVADLTLTTAGALPAGDSITVSCGGNTATNAFSGDLSVVEVTTIH